MGKKSEHLEQVMFVQWWRQKRPELGLIFAIPNGGQRNPVTAMRMKCEGVTKGVWDLFAPEQRLWIEFKRADGGALSPEQKEFGKAMLASGYRCLVAWGCSDAISQIENGERVNWRRIK